MFDWIKMDQNVLLDLVYKQTTILLFVVLYCLFSICTLNKIVYQSGTSQGQDKSDKTIMR